MSVRILSEIWEHSQAKGSELLLLLALADHADSTTAECYPSVKRLAKLIRMTKRNTQYLLRKLEEDGHITIKLKASPKKTNLYQIHRPWDMVKSFHLPACADETGCTSDSEKAIAPEPTSEPKPRERKNARAQDEDDFIKDIDDREKIKTFLHSAGISETSDIYHWSLNGHDKRRED